MADGENGPSPWNEFWIIFGILALLIFFWYVSGKPGANALGGLTVTSPFSTSTPHNWLPFVKGGSLSQATSTSYTSPASGNYSLESVSLPGFQTSALSGEIMIENDYAARATDPEEEYIVLYANPENSGPIDLSGWQLKSIKTGITATIPGAVETPHLGQAQSPSFVTLSPGDSAVVTVGRSPIGVSFRENECSGYLAQFQTYTPSFNLACPLPQNEVLNNSALAQDQTCVEAAANVPSCQELTSVPSGISQACADFMESNFNYNGCVLANQNDSNFEGSTWRLFLGLSSPMWNDTGDTIALLDTQGHLVATATY